MDLDLINDALVIGLALPAMADPQKPSGRVERAAVQAHLKIRRQVLEAHNWTSNDKTVLLTPEENGLVPPGFQYVGVPPADFLGLWAADQTHYQVVIVGDGESARKRIAWCGDATIRFRYAADIPYALMNPLLQQACRDALTANLAHVQSEKPAERKMHADIAVASEMKCVARDAINRKTQPLLNSTWDSVSQNAPFGFGDRPRDGSW